MSNMFGMGTAFDLYAMDTQKRQDDIKNIAADLKQYQDKGITDKRVIDNVLNEYGYKQTDLTYSEISYINKVLNRF